MGSVATRANLWTWRNSSALFSSSVLPQGLTLREFNQEGRSLGEEVPVQKVVMSDSYIKVRRQGRKGFTEVVQYNGPANIERSFESEVETKEILNKIDEINNALLDEYDEVKEESVDDIKSEARTGSDESKNAFLLFWEQILG